MDIEVVFGDNLGHPTSVQKWSSTQLAVSSGYLLGGDTLDWSNPDEGIFFQRLFTATKDGEFYNFLDDNDKQEGTDLGGCVRVFDRYDMDHALCVLVEGKQVLERAPEGEQADFDCGLRFCVDDEDIPVNEQMTDAEMAIAPKDVDAGGNSDDMASDE